MAYVSGHIETGATAVEPNTQRGRLATLWHQWLRELAALTGAGDALGSRRHLRFDISSDAAAVSIAKRRRVRDLAATLPSNPTAGQLEELQRDLSRKGIRTRDAVISLADDLVLKKRLTFPRAVETVIEPVLRNQLLRLTPWSDGEISLAYRIANDAGTTDEVAVDVVAAHRPMIEQLIETLAQAGLKCARVEHGQGKETLYLHDIGATRLNRAGRRIGWMIGALSAIAIGIGAYGALQGYRSYEANRNLETRIEQTQQRIAQRLGAASAHSPQAKDAAAFRAFREKSVSSLGILGRLTALLPDHTWLTEFTIDQGRIQLSGSSSNAAELIAILERSRRFTEVRFASSTIRDPQTGRESFTIEAMVVNPAAEQQKEPGQ